MNEGREQQVNIGAKIKELRIQKSLTQEELADRAASYRNIEIQENEDKSYKYILHYNHPPYSGFNIPFYFIRLCDFFEVLFLILF